MQNQKIVLKKNIIFNTSGIDNSTEKTIEYFTSSGFQLNDRQTDHLTFTRGSIFRNFWTFNPLKWKSEILIKFSNNDIDATFNINTIGQIATVKELSLWDSFIDNYGTAIKNSQFQYKEVNNKNLYSTLKNSFGIFGKFTFYSIVGVVSGTLLAHLIIYLLKNLAF